MAGLSSAAKAEAAFQRATKGNTEPAVRPEASSDFKAPKLAASSSGCRRASSAADNASRAAALRPSVAAG